MFTYDNPFDLFKVWFQEAEKLELSDYNAMTLATVNEVGQPSARIVLLKEFNEKKGVFNFFTNFESRKAREILTNPHVALCFHWKNLKKQVRIEGVAYTISENDADRYFSSRPLGSQIGAWASKQSQKLESREKLEKSIAKYAQKFGDGPISRPPHWGGFCVQPSQIEFWEEKPFRLHERLVYIPSAFDESGWEKNLLYP